MSTVLDGWGSVSPLPGMDIYEAQHMGGKGKNVILFRKFQKHMIKESELRGRPVYKEVDYITVIIPADQKLVIDHEVRQADIDKYPVEWERWKATQSNRIPGIPIEHWPQLTDTQKAEFKAMNIHTVEALAGLSDGNGQKIMGFAQLKQKALAYIEAGKDSEIIGKVRAEAESRIAAQDAKIAELTAMVEKLTAPSGKK